MHKYAILPILARLVHNNFAIYSLADYPLTFDLNFDIIKRL